MSIEQLNDFHLVRRILKAIAPDFRLLASSELTPGASVLDVSKKTIEIGETQNILFEAVPSLLFQIGHLVLHKNPRFALLFGNGIREWNKTADELIETLSDLGIKADAAAMRWASFVFTSYWGIEANRADGLLAQQMWTREEWAEYFST